MYYLKILIVKSVKSVRLIKNIYTFIKNVCIFWHCYVCSETISDVKASVTNKLVSYVIQITNWF